MSTGRGTHCTRSVALHPFRRTAPDQKGCNAYGSGAPPPQQTQLRTLALRYAPGLFHEGRARGTTPVTSRYTRYVAMHPIRRGAMPTDRVHRLPQQAQMRAFPSDIPNHSIGRRHTASTCSPRLRTRNAAPVRECYPPSSWCNTQLSGVTPLSNKYQCGNMPRLSSQITRQRSSAASEEMVHHRETGTGDEAANSSTHQLLGHSNTRTTCACQRLRSLCGDSHAISSLLRHTSSHGR